MKVLVLGAGVIGTTAAYYLARSGHEVAVVERREGPGLETSFANAGEVSPGYSAPWAGPGVPLKAVKWLLMRHRPLVIRPQLDWQLVRWCLSMLSNCTAARYEINKGRMVRVAEYSRDVLRQLRADTGIRYDERMQGTLQLFRIQHQLDGTGADIEVLRRYGVAWELLDREGCIRQEPALARVKEKFVGGLLLPGDETGDCFKFTVAMAGLASAAGVGFSFGTSVSRLNLRGGRIDSVQTDKGTLQADAYLVSLGSYSPLLLRPLGMKLPVYPVKGYSLTVPIGDPDTAAGRAPESTVMDETHKVAITRLDNRIRAGGTAELSGYNLSLHDARRRTLEHVVTDLFPAGSDVAGASFWSGLRPMTPDGTPVLGPTHLPNLWLSTGHGTLGWTMATGSGQLIADWMSGRQPAIDTDGLTIARFA